MQQETIMDLNNYDVVTTSASNKDGLANLVFVGRKGDAREQVTLIMDANLLDDISTSLNQLSLDLSFRKDKHECSGSC